MMDAIGMIDDELMLDYRPRRVTILHVIMRIAAAILLVFGIGYSAFFYMTRVRTVATVSFDVNPSLVMKLNSSGGVVSLEGVNGKGKDVAVHSTVDRESYTNTADNIVDYMLSAGYLNEDSNTFLVTVGDTDNTGYEKQVSQAIRGEYSDIAVLTNTLEADQKTRSIARRYNISLGKARLISALHEQSEYCTIAALARYNINDLCLFAVRSDIMPEGFTLSGVPSDTRYISEEQAWDQAVKDTGLSENAIKSYATTLSAEYNGLVYIVKFVSGDKGYAYFIDAADGRVLNVIHSKKNELGSIGKAKEKEDKELDSAELTAGVPPYKANIEDINEPTNGDEIEYTQVDSPTATSAVQPTTAPEKATQKPTETQNNDVAEARDNIYDHGSDFSKTVIYSSKPTSISADMIPLSFTEEYRENTESFDTKNYPQYDGYANGSCAMVQVFTSKENLDAFIAYSKAYQNIVEDTYPNYSAHNALQVLFGEEFFEDKGLILLMDAVESRSDYSEIQSMWWKSDSGVNRISINCKIHPDNVVSETDLSSRKYISLVAYSIDKSKLVTERNTQVYGN